MKKIKHVVVTDNIDNNAGLDAAGKQLAISKWVNVFLACISNTEFGESIEHGSLPDFNITYATGDECTAILDSEDNLLIFVLPGDEATAEEGRMFFKVNNFVVDVPVPPTLSTLNILGITSAVLYPLLNKLPTAAKDKLYEDNPFYPEQLPRNDEPCVLGVNYPYYEDGLKSKQQYYQTHPEYLARCISNNISTYNELLDKIKLGQIGTSSAETIDGVEHMFTYTIFPRYAHESKAQNRFSTRCVSYEAYYALDGELITLVGDVTDPALVGEVYVTLLSVIANGFYLKLNTSTFPQVVKNIFDTIDELVELYNLDALDVIYPEAVQE